MAALMSYIGQGPGLSYLIVALLVALAAEVYFLVRSRHRAYAGQIMVASAIIGLSIVALALTETFPRMGFGRTNDAADFPRLLIALLIPTCVIVIYRAVRRHEKKDEPFGRIDKVMAFAAALVLNVFLIPYIGYFVCAALFLFVTMQILGCRSLILKLIVSGGWVAFSYYVFHTMLYVRLPIGKVLESFMYR